MRKTVALALVAAACVVPALALAANPAKNSHFSWCPKKNICPITFSTNKKGSKIIQLTMYPKCAPVPPKNSTGWYPNMRVRHGKFHGEGTITDVLDHKVNYEITGKFRRPKKAVGKFHVTQKGCRDSEHRFVAKRDGKAG